MPRADRARVEEQRRQTQQARHDQCRGNRYRSRDQPDARPTRRLADRVGLRADRVDRGAGPGVQTLIDPCREHGLPHAAQACPRARTSRARARSSTTVRTPRPRRPTPSRRPPTPGPPHRVPAGAPGASRSPGRRCRAAARPRRGCRTTPGARARPPTAARCLPAGADRSGGRNPRSTCHAALRCRGSAAARGGPAPRPRPRAPSWRTMCAGARLHDVRAGTLPHASRSP